MCDIWTHKKDAEITPDQLRDVISDDLFTDLIAVGINGGEPTLRKDIGELVQVLVDEVPSLETIALITNAYSVKRVIQSIESISKACRSRLDKPVKLDVMVSIDGVGKVHDRVRGRDGNFDYASNVIDYALASKHVDSVRIGCTVIRENVYDLENLLDWSKRKGIYARFRLGVPHQRLGSNDGREAFQLNEAERFHLCNFLDVLRLTYEPQKDRRSFYKSLRDQIAYNAPRAVGCYFKTRGATLLPRGELAYCAVESKTLGSLIEDKSASEVYFGNLDHLKEIQENKCADCSHDYDFFPTKKGELRRIARRGYRKLNRFGKFNRFRTDPRLKRLRSAEKIVAESGIPKPIQRKAPRILLCGWYGTETLGDKAILAGVVRLLREVFESPVFSVASLEYYVSENTRCQMSELSECMTVSHVEAHRQIENGEYDAVFMAGGPLMAPVYECLEIAELFACGRKSGLPVGVLGCGIGPLWDGQNDYLKAVLNFSNIRIFRDEKSLGLARDFGFGDGAIAGVDPAWWWLKDQHNDVVRDDSKVLLALRDWPIQEYAKTLGMDEAHAIKDRFEAEILIAVRRLLDAGKTVIPFCMHKFALGGDDRQFYQRLFADEPRVLKELDMKHRPPAEDLCQFSDVGCALTMRFHSCVFALATGTPFEAIDYTCGGKVAALLDENGLEQRCSSIADFDGLKVAESLLNPECLGDAYDISVARSEREFQVAINESSKLLSAESEF
jgi:polysaccharide pyruvyl transferase WcaK-like protein/MoaA/NifB/PqqE/SkfB family radical SAM enzyme